MNFSSKVKLPGCLYSRKTYRCSPESFGGPEPRYSARVRPLETSDAGILTTCNYQSVFERKCLATTYEPMIDWSLGGVCSAGGIRINKLQRVKLGGIGLERYFRRFSYIYRSNFVPQIDDFFAFFVFHMQKCVWGLGQDVGNQLVFRKRLRSDQANKLAKFAKMLIFVARMFKSLGALWNTLIN